MIKFNKKVAAALGAGAIAVAGSGVAYAYWTTTGSGTGTATVGTTTEAGDWGVVKDSGTGTMYPGEGNTVVTFTITNNSNGGLAIESGQLSAAMEEDSNNDVTSAGVAQAGCLAAWFTPTVESGLTYPIHVAKDATTSVDVTVVMSDEASTNQDDCKNVTPDVTLSVG